MYIQKQLLLNAIISRMHLYADATVSNLMANDLLFALKAAKISAHYRDLYSWAIKWLS